MPVFFTNVLRRLGMHRRVIWRTVRFLIILSASIATIYIASWAAFVLMIILIFSGPADYQKLQAMRDEKTGLFVELGRVETMLDIDFFLLVFEDDAVRTELSWSGSPAIVHIAKLGSDTAVLSYEDGCYVVKTQWGDLETPTWRDPRTGEELCFRLRLEPDERPRFGAKP